jgi:transposase
MQAMLPSEIAELYAISAMTLKNWLKPFIKGGVLRRYNSKYYTPKQVAYIYECLGEPNDKTDKNAKTDKKPQN